MFDFLNYAPARIAYKGWLISYCNSVWFQLIYQFVKKMSSLLIFCEDLTGRYKCDWHIVTGDRFRARFSTHCSECGRYAVLALNRKQQLITVLLLQIFLFTHQNTVLPSCLSSNFCTKLRVFFQARKMIQIKVRVWVFFRCAACFRSRDTHFLMFFLLRTSNSCPDALCSTKLHQILIQVHF